MTKSQFAFWLFQKTVLPLFCAFLRKRKMQSRVFENVNGKTVIIQICDVLTDTLISLDADQGVGSNDREFLKELPWGIFPYDFRDPTVSPPDKEE